MHQEGSIVLGIGSDNSNASAGSPPAYPLLCCAVLPAVNIFPEG